MSMHPAIRIALPPVVLAVLLSLIYLLPMNTELQESAISPQLPYGTELDGWYGEKTQASKEERGTLAADTIFSKGIYRRCTKQSSSALTSGTDGMFCYGAPVSVSIVYSGSDMNSSIHRPERCLPSQGHVNLQTSSSELTLTDGRTISLTRLTSRVPLPNRSDGLTLNFISYYVFIGHGTMRHTHLGRTLQDMYDRVAKGYVQRWAYFQASSYWAPELNLTEEETDKRVRALISELLPTQINWDEM